MSYVIGRGRNARQTYPRPTFGGAGLLQGHFVQPVNPGENQDVNSTAMTNLLNGNGAPLQSILLNDVRPDSVFRVSFGIGQMFATSVVGGGAEILFRGILFNNDDVNFPAGYNAFGADLGTIAGVVTFASTAFRYEAYISQQMIAAAKVDGEPTFGKLGLAMQVALTVGGGDVVRIPLLPFPESQQVYVGIEELAGGALTIEGG